MDGSGLQVTLWRIALEAVGAGGLQRLQHGRDVVAELEVGVADDGGGGACFAIGAAGAGGGETLHKFDLAHGFELIGAVGAVHGAGLDEHGGADVVAGVEVGHQFMEEIALVWDAPQPAVPEMMVRVAQGDIGFDGFFLGQGQPVVVSEGHIDSSREGWRGRVFCLWFDRLTMSGQIITSRGDA